MTKLPLMKGVVGAALSAGMSAGCGWIGIASNSFGYPTTATGESANVVIHGTRAYASLAEAGFEVVDLSTGQRIRVIAPPEGSESVDDLAVADGFLFVLDARPPGHLSVLLLDDASSPELASAPIGVDVGPFSGVAAAGGRVIVSGGTSALSLRTYDRQGRLGSEVATIDLGRGQPDVLLAADGEHAFVSTHQWGPYFGLTTLDVGATPPSLVRSGSIDLDTFGFTAGGAKPASFPIEASLDGDVLLVAYVRGVAVISLGDPLQPRLLSVLDVGVEAVNVDSYEGAAAVVGSSPEPRLILLDVARPSAPVIERSVPLPEGSLATSVAIDRTHVVVAAHHKGTLVFQRQGWLLRPEGS